MKLIFILFKLYFMHHVFTISNVIFLTSIYNEMLIKGLQTDVKLINLIFIVKVILTGRRCKTNFLFRLLAVCLSSFSSL